MGTSTQPSMMARNPDNRRLLSAPCSAHVFEGALVLLIGDVVGALFFGVSHNFGQELVAPFSPTVLAVEHIGQ
jgi:hypothetical protein